ncbi:polar tube protein 2 [Ordospora colligata]|uniref:Polar tube protein 2 n=1 Tax=Ordospora colligata OC4 TaxID=1354746 RepID=A0A0B2UKF5_9MICR|nr:polar tube protein 2 [Ordospora colligata OC4]KHN69527.1 polar tube protein 2 [Ordospora colligata OC4]TBU15347.1 polar tube protein 2 [Ordospora colligata]TBU15447.1 polar tube protein 2 [Ordospora colligata]TBU18543.1 polar tube protein 2 [Ordospora colligata]
MLLSFAVVAFIGSCIATETMVTKPMTYPTMHTLPLQVQQGTIMQGSRRGSQCAILGEGVSDCAKELQKKQEEKERNAQIAASIQYHQTMNEKAENKCIKPTLNGSDVCAEQEFLKQAATNGKYTISTKDNVVMLKENDLVIGLAVHDRMTTVPVKEKAREPDPLTGKKETREVKLNQFGQVVGLSGPPSKPKDDCVCPNKTGKSGKVTFEMATRSCADACASKNIMYDAMVQNNSSEDEADTSKPSEEETAQTTTDNNNSGNTEQITENNTQ